MLRLSVAWKGNGQLNFGRVFDTGDIAYAGAVRLENPFPDLGDGQYKFSYYSVDATGQGTPSAAASTQGLSIQIDQDVGEVGLFAKYHHAFGRQGLVRQSAAAGAVWKNPSATTRICSVSVLPGSIRPRPERTTSSWPRHTTGSS